MDHAITTRAVVLTAGGLMVICGFGLAILTVAAARQSDSGSDEAMSSAKACAAVGVLGLLALGAGFWL